MLTLTLYILILFSTVVLSLSSIILVVLIVVGVLWLQPQYYWGPKSDHFDGKKFFNREEYGNMSLQSIIDFMKWRFRRYYSKRNSWPKKINISQTNRPTILVANEDIRVTNVGHATFLIQVGGLNILTDPVWSERVGPLKFWGPKRVIGPGILFDDLPKVDVLWISHNHYDHLDLPTIKKLWKKFSPRIVAPLGTDYPIRSFHSAIKVEVYDWHSSVDISDKVKFHIEPAHHWSSRQIFDHRMALWAALLIDTPAGKIYFVGDTAYAGGEHFKKIYQQYGKPQVAILPMGAYEPRWFLEQVHMNPDDMIRAHIDLGRPMTIPSHYDVFPLAEEDYGRALADLDIAMKKHGVDDDSIMPMKIGEAKGFVTQL